MKTIKTFALLIAMLFTLQLGFASTISPGDIAFIGYNTDDPDGFTFVAINNLPGNDILKFSDGDIFWFSQAGILLGAGSESELAWTTPPGGVPCGSIIEVMEIAPDTFSVTLGTIAHSGDPWELADGDQVYAFQGLVSGDVTGVNWIAAIHGDYDPTSYNATTHWNLNDYPIAGNVPEMGNNPFVALGQTNYGIALFHGTPEMDNAHYSGPLTGDKAAIHAATQDPNNWTFNDSTAMNNGPGDYASVSIPSCCIVSIDSLANVSCIGTSDGHVAVSSTGGTGAYTYLWSNGSTSSTNSNLVPGLYTLIVTDSSCTGSAWTNIESACNAPENLRAFRVQDTTITLDWQAVCGAPSYKVLYRQAGTAAWSVAGFSQNNRHTISGLSASTTYHFAIRTKCSGNTWSGNSQSLRAVTLAQPCATPSGLSAAPVQAAQARLNWATVSGAVKYRVRYRATGTTAWTTIKVSAPRTKLWITGLASAQAYEWQMKAVCQYGVSNGTEWTTVQTFTTPSSQKQASIGSASAFGQAPDVVYPNPSTTGNFVLQPGDASTGSAGPADETATYRIVDISGRAVLQGRINAAQPVPLDLSATPAGIYMLMIQGNTGLRVHKLIKQ